MGHPNLTNLHPPERVDAYTAAGLWGAPLWPDLLSRHTDQLTDRTAVVDPPNYFDLTGSQPTRVSWRTLRQRVRRLAATLLSEGVGTGDVVAIQLPNGVDLTVGYLAIAEIGAVATPFPVQYREYELAQMCELAGAVAFVTTTRVGAHPIGAWAAAAAAATPSLRRVLSFGSDAPVDAVQLDEVLGTEVDLGPLDEHRAGLVVTANDAVTVCWTSGTESRPKGVPRCPNDWRPMALATVDGAELTVDDVLLNPFPMVNMAGIAGMLLPWLMTGATLHQHHPFDVGVFFQQLTTEGITYTVAPPAVLVRALDMPQCTPESLATVRIIGSGSAPLPPSMITAFGERFDIDVLNYFGSNEGISLVSDHRNVPDPVQRATLFPRVGSSEHSWDNRAFAGLQMRLVEPSTGEEITETDTPGELLLKGPGVFSGYLAGTAPSDPFDAEGWFRTGDLLQLVADDSGDVRFLQYVDRAKDLIIRGGMNISPAELESLIIAHPRVAEVAVIGVPDPTFGERTQAVVALHPGESLTLEELLEFLREQRIATYKLPERLQIVESLPRNPVGKILKHELRAAQA